MNVFSKYGYDPKKAEGTPFAFDGMTFTLRPANSKLLQHARGIAAMQYRDVFDNLDDEDNSRKAIELMDRELSIQAFFDARVILGWSNVEGENGPLEFNRENWVRVMMLCPEVWSAVRKAAEARDLFKIEDGETLGNF